MGRKNTLIHTSCRRCDKPLVTMTRSIYGLDSLKAEYGSICEDCISKEEKDKLLKSMSKQIVRRL
jgi:hypothetical protein